MTTRVFSAEAQKKLKQIVDEGMRTMNEVETLNAGLSETIKAVAEEIEVKPSILKKAIKLAFKSSLTQVNKDHEDLNLILESVGKIL